MRVYGIQVIESKVRLSVDPKGVIAGTSQVDTSMQRTMDKTKKAVNQFGYLYLSLKRIATYTAIFSFFAKTIQLLGQVVELELRQAEVMTLIDMRNKQAAASYSKVMAQIRQMPPKLGSMIDLTKGLYEIMSAGVGNAEEAFTLLNVSAKYAKAGLMELGTAAETMTSIMKAYGLAAEDMRAKSDSMFAAVMEGKFHAEDFNASLGKILPTAAAMGVSIEEVGAMMAVLSQRGLDAAQSATSFNRMLISLLKPMDKAKTKLDMLGIEYGINAFRVNSLGEVLVKLADAQQRYGDILPSVFRRQRGLKAAFIATGIGLADYERMLKKVIDAQLGEGEVARAAEKIHNTLSDTMKAVSNDILRNASEWQKHSKAAKTAVVGLGQIVVSIMKQPAALIAAAAAHKAYSAALQWQASRLLKVGAAWDALEVQRVRGTVIDYRRQNALKAEAGLMNKRIARMKKLRTGFMLATIAIVAAIEVGRRWIAQLREEYKELEKTSKEMRQIGLEAENISNVIERATGKFRDLDPVVQNLAKHLAATELQQAYEAFLKEFSDADTFEIAQLAAWSELRTIILKTTHTSGLWSKRNNEMEDEIIKMRDAIMAGTATWEDFDFILEKVAQNGGYVSRALTQIEKDLLELPGEAGDAFRELQREFLFLMRDIPDLLDALAMHKNTIKETFDADKIRSLVHTLKQLKEGLSPEMLTKFTKAGIDLDKIDIPALLTRLNEALRELLKEDAIKSFNEGVNLITRNFDELAPSLDVLDVKFRQVMKAFAISKEMKIPIKTFAKEAEDFLKILFINFERLTPEMQAALEQFRKFVEKGGATANKARENAIKKAEDWANDYINIMRNVATMENKLRDESYKNIVDRTKAAHIIKKRQLEEELDDLIKHNALSLVAMAQYMAVLAAMRREAHLAEQVAEADRILAVRKANEDLLGSNYEYNFQKIAAAKKAYAEEIKLIQDSQILDEAMKAERLKSANTFWGNYIENLELAKSKYEKLIAVMEVFGGMFSRMASSFRDMFEALDLNTTFTTNMVDIIDTLGRSFLKISGAIKDAEKALESWGTEGENFLNKLGKVATLVDLIVTVATTLVTVFAKLFGGESDESKAAKEAIRVAAEQEKMIRKQMQLYENFGGLSESMAKAWAELRQSGIPGWLAELQLLDRIMSDVGINIDNFTMFAEKMADVLYATRDGFLESYEGADIFGKAFKQLIDYAKAHGIEGSKAILDLIKLTREMGIEIAEMSAYVNEQLLKAAGGLAAMIEWVAKEAVEAHATITDLTKEKKKLLREVDRVQERMAKYGFGSTEYKEAKDELDKLLESISELDKQILKAQGVIDDVGMGTRKQLLRLGNIALGVYSAMIAEGKTLFEINEAMGASINMLIDRYKALGIEVPAHLQSLFKIFRSMDANSEFYAGMQGLLDVYSGLGNAFYLSAEQFKDLNKEARHYWNLMKTPKKEGGLGLGDTAAMQMMYPLLQKMWWYAEQYNLKLPKWAREAKEKMEKAGFVFEAPIENQQLDYIKNLDALAVDRNEHLKNISKNIWLMKNAVESVPAYQHGSAHIGGGHFARLHSGEAVVPSNLADAMRQFFSGRMSGDLGFGGGGATHIVVNLDGQQVYKGLLPHIREGGSYGDFELAGEGVS